MRKPNVAWIILAWLPILNIQGHDFVSHLTFIEEADFTFEPRSRGFDPSAVQPGSIIYVGMGVIDYFFRDHHPAIPHPYILITHQGDRSIPGRYAYALNDDKLIAWFGINVDYPPHPKMHRIPIGLYFSKLNRDIWDELFPTLDHIERNTLVYMNFTIGTYPMERAFVKNLFKDAPYCYYRDKFASFDQFLRDLASSKFVLSPRGGGWDCYRTWEALYVGAIPIVRSCSLDPLYEGLPVLIVQKWEDISEEYLLEKYREIQEQPRQLEKLTPAYWQEQIREVKRDWETDHSN